MFRFSDSTEVVVTVKNESDHGDDRVSRSDEMVPLFQQLLLSDRNMEVIQMFSGGSSMSPALKSEILGAVGDGRIKCVVIAGVEMTVKEIKNFSDEITAKGGSLVWMSGGSDQYEVVKEGPPSNTSGNFRSVDALDSGAFAVVQVPAGDAIYDEEGVLDGCVVNVVHNCPLRFAAAQVHAARNDRADGDGPCIIHFVSHEDTLLKAKGEYSKLAYSHGNMGTIALCSTLFGGIDSGNPNHTFTNAWIKNSSSGLYI